MTLPAPSNGKNGLPDMQQRIGRLEVLYAAEDKAVERLSAWTAVLEGQVSRQGMAGDGIYQSFWELASALMRVERHLDQLARDNQELWRKIHELEALRAAP